MPIRKRTSVGVPELRLITGEVVRTDTEDLEQAHVVCFAIKVHPEGERGHHDSQEDTYLLEAMTSAYYNGWFLERDIEGQLEAERDIPPLIIPDDIAAVEGLVAAVQRRYLDREAPTAINALRNNLHGPYRS